MSRLLLILAAALSISLIHDTAKADSVTRSRSVTRETHHDSAPQHIERVRTYSEPSRVVEREVVHDDHHEHRSLGELLPHPFQNRRDNHVERIIVRQPQQVIYAQPEQVQERVVYVQPAPEQVQERVVERVQDPPPPPVAYYTTPAAPVILRIQDDSYSYAPQRIERVREIRRSTSYNCR